MRIIIFTSYYVCTILLFTWGLTASCQKISHFAPMVDALRGQDERRLIQGERGVLVVSCSHCSQLAVTLRLLLDHRDDRWRAEHSVPPPWSVTRVFVCNMPLSHYSMVLAHHGLKVFQWKIYSWTGYYSSLNAFMINFSQQVFQLSLLVNRKRSPSNCNNVDMEEILASSALLTLHCRTIWPVIYLLNYLHCIIITCHCFSRLHRGLLFFVIDFYYIRKTI